MFWLMPSSDDIYTFFYAIYICIYTHAILFPKIHKWLHDVPGRPVISNSAFYTENISSLISHLSKMLSCTLKIQITSYVNWLAFLLCWMLYMLLVFILIYCMMRG